MRFDTVRSLVLVAASATVMLGLSGCATSVGHAAAPISDHSAAGSSTPVPRTREDAQFEKEMRASGWDRDASGVYFRIGSGGVCSGSCVVELLDPIGCPTGIQVEGVRDLGDGAALVSLTSPAAPAGGIVTVTVPPPSVGTRIESAACGS